MTDRTVTALFALMLVAGRVEAQAGQGQEEAAVRAAVQAYFDGMMAGDQALLKKAFHAESFLIGPGAKDATRIPFANWHTSFTKPMANPTEYRNSILSIDVVGQAAVAKTELDWPRVRYVDYLSLLKVNGEWKIVNKIWHQEPSARAQAEPPISARPLSTAEMQKYIGEYQMPQGPVYVTVQDGKLMTRLGFHDEAGFQLHYQGNDTFIPSIDRGIRMVFKLADGKATGFAVTQNGETMEGKRVQ
ncbi:MAG: nuclear transport factor 2 family protein [Gemmatimonadota bacterium]